MAHGPLYNGFIHIMVFGAVKAVYEHCLAKPTFFCFIPILGTKNMLSLVQQSIAGPRQMP